ncbi:MAG: hypothetical protein H7343_11730 [Undibacterium sp.]|nr:hypothetical protein [Opitutaceae bacterium]
MFLALIWCAGLWAAPAPIPEVEALQLPKSARLAEITRTAAPDQWAQAIPVLRAAARTAYEHDKLAAASGWLNVTRWAMLFAQTEAEFIPAWIKAIESAHVGHANMPTRFEMTDRSLGRWLSADLQGWLMGNAAFSDEFFTLLAPQDNIPAVFQILNSLHQGDPAKFARYASLALAIAVVYDVAPPPWWPHAQVSASALPRKLPAPADAFAWWIKEDIAGRTFHRLTRLPADELKFVVDAAAPFGELTWSQQIADYPLGQLDKAYTMIRNRQDRIANNNPIWPGPTYAMHFILRDGGICVDQAYFATETGKARGVPTLLFYGAGNDGRHAWFGFLDGAQKWQFDAGRYAEQRFVTGLALDPQTWREISDHELKFLAERFRTLPTFRQSQTHVAFAADYLATGSAAAAVNAARKAVAMERRNVTAWETLTVAEVALGRTPRQLETTLREAARALQLYPDLEATFVKRVCASLRARGEKSAADAEEAHIALKNQSKRGDLSTQQARDILLRSLSADKLPAQVQVYHSVLNNFGRGAGIGFFDQVVVPFVQHLVQLGDKPAADRAIARARQTLKVEANSQLESEFARLLETVRGKTTRP